MLRSRTAFQREQQAQRRSGAEGGAGCSCCSHGVVPHTPWAEMSRDLLQASSDEPISGPFLTLRDLVLPLRSRNTQIRVFKCAVSECRQILPSIPWSCVSRLHASEPCIWSRSPARGLGFVEITTSPETVMAKCGVSGRELAWARRSYPSRHMAPMLPCTLSFSHTGLLTVAQMHLIPGPGPPAWTALPITAFTAQLRCPLPSMGLLSHLLQRISFSSLYFSSMLENRHF